MAAGKALEVEAPVVAVERKRKQKEEKAAPADEAEDDEVARKRAKKAAKKAAALEAAAKQEEAAAKPKAAKAEAKAQDEPEGLTVVTAEAFREKFGITAPGGEELPEPVQRFEDAPFGKKVIAGLLAAGFAAPSPIQAQAWPVAVTGRDLVAIAKTGSGKTLGFLLPAFRLIAKAPVQEPGAGAAEVLALVLAPTRELVAQIEVECKKFEVYSKTTSTAVFGGVPKDAQLKALKRRPQVCVATPGRLQDLMEMKAISLKKVSFMVLDEGDRMLDMGFEPEIANILGHTPKERQTLLFSATWPKSVQRIAEGYLKDDHLHINVGATEELSANKSVKQEFFKLNDEEKELQLWRLIADLGEENKLICFTNTKRRVAQLTKNFYAKGYEAASLHGDKVQKERDRDLAMFASGERWLLFATDVCARGLDIKDVTHVVNYDMARDVESYVHRIGRTGRAGRSGKSITFWNEDYDMECAPALVKIAKEAGHEVPDWLEKAAEKQTQVKNKAWRY